MRSSRDKIDLDERKTVFLGNNAISRDDLFSIAAFYLSFKDLYCIGLLILNKISAERSFFFIKNSVNCRKIFLFDLSVFDLFVHNTKGLRVLCSDNYSARITVYSVTQRRRERVFLGGVILTLLVEISADM